MKEAPTTSEASGGRKVALRVAALAVAVLTLVLIGRLTSLGEHFTVSAIQAMARDAGPWGVLVFLASAALGGILHVPGVVFLLAGPLLYGKLLGAALAWLGALLYAEANFLLIRGVGGQPLADLKRPIIRRLVDRLAQRPLTWVALIRATFWMAAPANYTLSMSSISGRDHFLGSAIGLIPAALFNALFVEWAVSTWA